MNRLDKENAHQFGRQHPCRPCHLSFVNQWQIHVNPLEKVAEFCGFPNAIGSATGSPMADLGPDAVLCEEIQQTTCGFWVNGGRGLGPPSGCQSYSTMPEIIQRLYDVVCNAQTTQQQLQETWADCTV